MNYNLVHAVLDLTKEFEAANEDATTDIEAFKRWVADNFANKRSSAEPDWEGKLNGRGPDSVINTAVVHLNRYARTYSRAAIVDSAFSTQDEFVYLIILRACGEMTKMDLIKRNIQEKPVGMQIINRLVGHGWVTQKSSETDKRSKVISITPKGIEVLEGQMIKIRQATAVVTGDLTYDEKMELIRLLNKLKNFHYPIYNEHLDPAILLQEAMKRKSASVQT